MNNKDINAVVHIAVEAGRIILENGGETYRVEDTINRICTAFGVRRAESFVTPTGIMMSVTAIDGSTTSMVKRIQVRTVNLDKICKVNELSRNIYKYVDSMDEIINILKEIDNTPRYSGKKTIFFSTLAAGFFTLLMGGTFQDFLMALIVGFFIKSTTLYLKNLQINDFFINIVGGALAMLLSLILNKMSLVANFDELVIGSIMLLVPGLAITNAIRDTIAGDLVSGLARAIEAFLVAIGIAIGSGMILGFWISTFGGIS